MRLRSGRLVNMPGGSDDDAKPVTVAHTVTNYKSGIEPFAGRINGQLKQGLETFIESIENHLASRSITDAHEQFVEAKSHFNLSQGDLGDCTRSLFFRDCRTWGNLKGFLRSTYGSGEQKDIVLDCRRVLKLHDRDGNSFVSQNAKINDGILDFISNLGNSDWADLDARRGISLRNLGRLLQLAVSLHSLPEALVNSFDERLTPTSTEKDVMTQIHKHVGKLVVSDSTILNGSPKEGKSVCVVPRVQNNSSRPNRNYQSTQSSSSSGGFSQRRTFKCFNCDREGHVKQNCNVRYCGFHQSNTHNWKECRVLKTNNRFPNTRGRSQSGDRKFRNHSSNRNGNRNGYRNGSDTGNDSGSSSFY